MLVLLAACAFASPRRSHAGESLSYSLAPDFDRGLLRVEVTWDTAGRTLSALGVSRQWGTLEDVTSVIHDVVISGGELHRRQGPLWIIRHPRDGQVRVTYEVRPGQREFDWPVTHYPITTPRFFHGMGNAFLLVPHNEEGVSPELFETTLRWKLRAGQQAACSWGVGRHVGRPISAADLRSSVYVAGDLRTRQLIQDGVELNVALVDGVGFTPERFAERMMPILVAERDFMREPKFPPFVITAIPVGKPARDGDVRLSGSGLYDSFALFTPPETKLDDAIEHLFAHELFHQWNGRRLPAADPERQVFWFVEGFTDYYALRILHESGRWDDATFCKWMNRHLRDYVRNPAMHATNDEIEKRFWSDRSTFGEVAYQRGLVLALRWHSLAQSRGVKAGIDDWIRGMVAEGAQGRLRLTNAELRRRGVQAFGGWFGEEFDRYVIGAAEVPAPPDALAPRIIGRTTDVYDYELGFDRRKSLEKKRASGVKSGGPAATAGLRDGDELTGWKLPAEEDQRVELQVRRGERLEVIRFFPRGKRRSVTQYSPAGAAGATATP